MRTFESEKLKEVDALKSRFFANISHEFRTPITLILGPLENMLPKIHDTDMKQDLTLMQRNARRLLRLINQLLDLSKLEAGRLQLRAYPDNVVPLLNRFVQSFESQAKLKGINLTFRADEKSILMYVDPDKLENIIYNLVSNALKFTPAGGAITVGVKVKEHTDFFKNGYIEIIVKDTGSGMSHNQLDKIFDRFYQADASTTREHEGSGIGLALTKELVELFNGNISVESEPGVGTAFTVCLPLGRDHLKDDDIIEDISVPEEPVQPTMPESPDSEEISLQASQKPSATQTKGAPIVLIVEDNGDLRNYMREILQPTYRVKEAADGEKGQKQAIQLFPDLIISDVMMPVMDGITMCQKLKTDQRTSHIPVILLTARAGLESTLEGLETGADDYIVKPFETKELLLRVKNLLDNRRKMRERFSTGIHVNPSEISVTSMDENFLNRAIDIIEKNMGDFDFTVDEFAHAIGLSRTQLHRKLRALTNQSAREFIRILRLKRAATLLEHHAGNIAEIAYQVGFNKPSYFTECFRKQFGQLPSDYKADHSKSNQ